jgi:hypothetical protein
MPPSVSDGGRSRPPLQLSLSTRGGKRGAAEVAAAPQPAASSKAKAAKGALGTTRATAKAEASPAKAELAEHEKRAMPSMIGNCVCSRCAATSDTKPWACEAETPSGLVAAGRACLECMSEWNDHFSHIQTFEAFVAHSKTARGAREAAEAKMNAQRRGGKEFHAASVSSTRQVGCVLKRSLVVLNRREYKEAISKAPTKRHPKCPKIKIINENGEEEEVHCFSNPAQPYRTLELYCDISDGMVTQRLGAGKNAFETHAQQTLTRCSSVRSQSMGHQILFGPSSLHTVDHVRQKVLRLAQHPGGEGADECDAMEEDEGFGFGGREEAAEEVRIVEKVQRSTAFDSAPGLPDLPAMPGDRVAAALALGGPTPKKRRLADGGGPGDGHAHDSQPEGSPSPLPQDCGKASSVWAGSDARTVRHDSGDDSGEGSAPEVEQNELQKWTSKLSLDKVVAGAKLQRQVRFATKSMTTKMNKNDAGIMREHLKLVPAPAPSKSLGQLLGVVQVSATQL